jgi:hypothetical protein
MHMTQAKKLKRAIRARSRKTGESYSAARRQLLKAGTRTTTAGERPARAAAATRGGMSEASAVRRTGHGLDHWFAVLDAFGAAAKGHTAAATHLHEDHGVPGWHAQGITVAYERARGLRAPNQAGGGTFQVSVSRAVPASVAEVADAIRDPRRRREWLRGADPGLARALHAAFAGESPRDVKVRDASNARLRYPWQDTAVEIRITGKPKGGATVAADNTKLRDRDHVERRREQWQGALDALKAHLTR